MNYEGFIDGTPVLEPSRQDTNRMAMPAIADRGRMRGASNAMFPPAAERRALNELWHAIIERQRHEFTTTE